MACWLLQGLRGRKESCAPVLGFRSSRIQGAGRVSSRTQRSRQARGQRATGRRRGGAIAISDTGGALGITVGASSAREAKRLAVADCRAKGGGGCRSNFAYRNQCAVAIIGSKTFRMFGAASIQEATEIGIKDCAVANKGAQGCRVYYAACTKPIFYKY